jgi:hypothetical protein
MGGEADSEDELRRLVRCRGRARDGDHGGGRLRRVVARGRDYLPDSGRFDVSAPGTPFASPGHGLNLGLLTEATRRRRA